MSTWVTVQRCVCCCFGNHAAENHTVDALLGSKLAFLFLFWGGDTIFLMVPLDSSLLLLSAQPCLALIFFFLLSWNGYIWLEETWIPSSLPPPLHLPEWSSFLWHIQYHQHYWPDILMRRGLAAKRHLAAAYWACSWLKRQDSRCSPGEKDYHTQTQNFKQKQQNRFISKSKQFKNVTLVTTNNRWH